MLEGNEHRNKVLDAIDALKDYGYKLYQSTECELRARQISLEKIKSCVQPHTYEPRYLKVIENNERAIHLIHAYIAAINAMRLADQLRKIFTEWDYMPDNISKSYSQKVYFEYQIEIGYKLMGENRRVGYIHSLLIAIASIWQAFKAYCGYPNKRADKDPILQVGEQSPGFFALTTRQNLLFHVKTSFDAYSERAPACGYTA